MEKYAPPRACYWLKHWTKKNWNATLLHSLIFAIEAKFYLQTRVLYLQARGTQDILRIYYACVLYVLTVKRRLSDVLVQPLRVLLLIFEEARFFCCTKGLIRARGNGLRFPTGGNVPVLFSWMSESRQTKKATQHKSIRTRKNSQKLEPAMKKIDVFGREKETVEGDLYGNWDGRLNPRSEVAGWFLLRLAISGREV